MLDRLKRLPALIFNKLTEPLRIGKKLQEKGVYPVALSKKWRDNKRVKRSRKNKLKLWNESQICSLCGEKIEDVEDATWDHIIPRSKGGADSAENLALAHSWCNGEKGDLSPWVYRIFRFLNIALFKVRPGRPSKRLTKAWKDREDYSEDDSQ